MAGCCLECGLVALWLLPTVEVLRPCLPATLLVGRGRYPEVAGPPPTWPASASAQPPFGGRFVGVPWPSPAPLVLSALPCSTAFPGWRNAALGWPAPGCHLTTGRNVQLAIHWAPLRPLSRYNHIHRGCLIQPSSWHAPVWFDKWYGRPFGDQYIDRGRQVLH